MKKLLMVILLVVSGCATSISNQYAQQEVLFATTVTVLTDLRVEGKISDADYLEIDKIIKLGTEYLDTMSIASNVNNIEKFDELNKKLNRLIILLRSKYNE